MSEKMAELCGLLMPLLETGADGTFALLSSGARQNESHGRVVDCKP